MLRASQRSRRICRDVEDTNVAVRFRSRRATCTAPTRRCRSARTSHAGGAQTKCVCEPAPASSLRPSSTSIALAGVSSAIAADAMVVPASGGKQCQGEQRRLDADCLCPQRTGLLQPNQFTNQLLAFTRKAEACKNFVRNCAYCGKTRIRESRHSFEGKKTRISKKFRNFTPKNPKKILTSNLI